MRLFADFDFDFLSLSLQNLKKKLHTYVCKYDIYLKCVTLTEKIIQVFKCICIMQAKHKKSKENEPHKPIKAKSVSEP